MLKNLGRWTQNSRRREASSQTQNDGDRQEKTGWTLPSDVRTFGILFDERPQQTACSFFTGRRHRQGRHARCHHREYVLKQWFHFQLTSMELQGFYNHDTDGSLSGPVEHVKSGSPFLLHAASKPPRLPPLNSTITSPLMQIKRRICWITAWPRMGMCSHHLWSGQKWCPVRKVAEDHHH